jgi:hypothetical protein
MKKAQSMMVGLGITLLLAVIIFSLIYTSISSQTTVTAVTDDTLTLSNTSCTQLTPQCINSITTIENATSAADVLSASNYSICTYGSTPSGILLTGGASGDALWNGETVNVTYTETACNYISGTMTRTIISHLPMILAVVLLVFVGGYVALK